MAKTVFFERGYLAGYCVKRRRVLGHLRGCKLPSPAPCFPCLPRVSALKGSDGIRRPRVVYRAATIMCKYLVYDDTPRVVY